MKFILDKGRRSGEGSRGRERKGTEKDRRKVGRERREETGPNMWGEWKEGKRERERERESETRGGPFMCEPGMYLAVAR